MCAVERLAVGERFEDEEDPGEGERGPADAGARERHPRPHWMPRPQRGVQVNEGQGHADDFGGEPDFTADGAGPGEGPEAEQQCEDGMVPFGSRAAFELLDAAQEEIEERNVRRREREGERDVVQVEPGERDEGQHEDSRERWERHEPAASFEHPVVQVRRARGEVKLAVQECIGLPDEMRGLRLVREKAPAGERVGEKTEDEEQEVDPVRAQPGAPARLGHAFPAEAP